MAERRRRHLNPVADGAGWWGRGPRRKPATRGTRFGAAGRRRLTEEDRPRRGSSAERSSRWQAGGVAGNTGDLVGEQLDVYGVLEEVAAG
jgi:hypothetical protein